MNQHFVWAAGFGKGGTAIGIQAEGGTVFVPGTHMLWRCGATGMAAEPTGLMELFSGQGVGGKLFRGGIFLHNLKKLWRMRQDEQAALAPGEFL